MGANIQQVSISHGQIGATPIVSTLDASGFASTRYVTLSGNYARLIPPGYPDPNAGAEVSKRLTNTPQTIPNGARLQFFAHEAAAIVAAGGGAYS